MSKHFCCININPVTVCKENFEAFTGKSEVTSTDFEAKQVFTGVAVKVIVSASTDFI